MTNTQVLAKEGLRGFVVLFFFCLVCFFFDFFILSYFLLFCLVFWAYIFRNPERLPEERLEGVYLSPCDGRIENIEYLDDRLLLTFRIGLLDTGVLRAPFDYKEEIKMKEIKGLNLYLSENRIKEKLNTKVELDGGDFDMEVMSEIFPAKFYLPIRWRMGDRIGFCKAGVLRLRLNLKAVDLKINIGDIVKSGETLLGYRK